MIKFFRKIRQKLLTENKFSKYALYAIGEIILVVIGIFIALQLNIYKENKSKSDLGYRYLLEMKKEVQDVVFDMDVFIRVLDRNIKKQEAALNTKDIAKLSLDSTNMIISPVEIDLKIRELTFSKMKNLGLNSISKNEKLSNEISFYYTTEIVDLKSSLDNYSDHFKKYQDFLNNKQNAIDFSFNAAETFAFPELYQQSRQELNNQNRINGIQFITSIKGRMLILKDLNEKKRMLWLLNEYYSSQTQSLIELIYNELKINYPQIEPLPVFPSEVDFKEISLSQDALKKYLGAYTSDDNGPINVLTVGKRIYVDFLRGSKFEIFPYEVDKFFVKEFFLHFQFNMDKGKIVSLTQNVRGEKIEYIKTK